MGVRVQETAVQETAQATGPPGKRPAGNLQKEAAEPVGRSSRPMRRASSDEEKEQRRDEILSAAKRVFAISGFHATTMADVAREAGVSYGTIYWYFDSKEALFYALMDAEEQALRAHIGQSVMERAMQTEDREIALDAIKQAIRATLEFFELDRDAARLLFRDSLSFGDDFAQHLLGIYERFIGDIEVAIRAAQGAGKIVDLPSRMVAFAVAALIGQVALRRLVSDDGFSAAEEAEFIVDLLLNGLLPR